MVIPDRFYVWIHRAFTTLSVVVFTTGAMLIVVYRPTAADAWNDIFALEQSTTFSTVTQDIHRWATFIWLWTLIPLVTIELARRARRSALLLVTTFILAVAATFTGYLLPWNQLALWGTAVGKDMSGYIGVLFSDDVRFILIDGTEVSVSTLRGWFFGHLGLGTVVLLMAGLARRSAPPPPSTPGNAPAQLEVAD